MSDANPSTRMLRVEVVQTSNAAGLGLPSYATSGSAGMDLQAAVDERVTLLPGQRAAIPTGIAVALPEGFEAQIRPRSGMAIKHGLTVVNAPGTIDSDYRGEIKALMINLGQAPVTIEKGDRIAQLVVAPIVRVQWAQVEQLPSSQRGAGGFGHTGV
jgi:dUTP pyrophosphatase